MPVATRCPRCKAKLKGPDALIGHTLKCPGCGTHVQITAESRVPPASPAPGALITKIPAQAEASPSKAPRYDDLEIVDDDAETYDETAVRASLQTEQSPRLAPVDHPRVPPSAKSPEKKSASATGVKPATNVTTTPTEKRLPPGPATPQTPPAPVAPASARKAAPKSNPADDFDLLDDLDLLPEAPAGPKTEAPGKASTPRPGLPNMELGNAHPPAASDQLLDMADISLQGDEEEVPLTAVNEDDEVFDDFEIFEEQAEEVVTLTPVEDQDEAIMDVVPVEEAATELEAIEEDALDDLEVVDEPAVNSAFSFKLLKPSVIFVQGQSGMFSINNAYDLHNGKSKKKLGEALEKKDDVATAMRLFVGNSLVPTRIEILEGPHRDLVLTVKRPPHLWTSKAEVFDNDGELLGSFEIQPFSALMSSAVWIRDHNEKKVGKMQAQWLKGKCVYSTPDGKKLAETMSQAVYEQRLVLRWAPRGGSFYITFSQLAEKKPRLKLLLLGVVIGIDLFFTQNRQGPIIGAR